MHCRIRVPDSYADRSEALLIISRLQDPFLRSAAWKNRQQADTRCSGVGITKSDTPGACDIAGPSVRFQGLFHIQRHVVKRRKDSCKRTEKARDRRESTRRL